MYCLHNNNCIVRILVGRKLNWVEVIENTYVHRFWMYFFIKLLYTMLSVDLIKLIASIESDERAGCLYCVGDLSIIKSLSSSLARIRSSRRWVSRREAIVSCNTFAACVHMNPMLDLVFHCRRLICRRGK